MELRELATRTQLSFRTVRYVVEHQVVPKSNVEVRGRGSVRPRLFTDETGILIASAAALLEGGVKRVLVQRVIDCLLHLERPVSRSRSEVVFDAIACGTGDARIEVGDLRLVRVVTGPPDKWDSGWLDFETLEGQSTVHYPSVIVQLDIGRIRNQVLHST